MRPQSSLLRFKLKVTFYCKIFIPIEKQIAQLNCEKKQGERQRNLRDTVSHLPAQISRSRDCSLFTYICIEK